MLGNTKKISNQKQNSAPSTQTLSTLLWRLQSHSLSTLKRTGFAAMNTQRLSAQKHRNFAHGDFAPENAQTLRSKTWHQRCRTFTCRRAYIGSTTSRVRGRKHMLHTHEVPFLKLNVMHSPALRNSAKTYKNIYMHMHGTMLVRATLQVCGTAAELCMKQQVQRSKCLACTMAQQSNAHPHKTLARPFIMRCLAHQVGVRDQVSSVDQKHIENRGFA